MHLITTASRRFGALAPAAAMLLLALCLLAGGAQAADVPRYVVGDVLEVDFANTTAHMVIARVDTTSLPEPLYTAFLVEQNAGRWKIPRYWHNDLEYTDESFERMHARRAAHVDPVLVIITDDTITGGDMLFYGLSLAEAKTGGAYWVEQPPGESSGSPYSYVVGDILGNVSDPNRGSVVSRVYESDGAPWARVYFDAVRSGDRWVLDKFYNGDMGFPMNMLGQNESRRVAHADPHTVIINDTTTNTGEIGWYRLSLAEFLAGKYYDWMGYWHFNTGDILSNGTATRYIVGNATVSDSGPSHYTLYEVVAGADGWEIPTWVNGGIPFEPSGAQLGDLPFDLVDHTDPHFAVVTDPAVAGGLSYDGLSLGEILEGTPGYPPESPGPIGGDTGYLLVSTTPAGASIYLVDISGTRYLKGTTSAGPLNVTIMLTATPMKQIVANLSGYHDAVYTITQYPAKGQTVPVSLTLEPVGPSPLKPLLVPGRIQAEDYNLGGEGVAYHDTTAGNEGGVYRRDDVDIEKLATLSTPDVGWIRNGEYLTYTANVTTAGAYTMTARVASPNSGRTVAVSDYGNNVATIAVPNTGSFAAFQDVGVPITLGAGMHAFRLTFAGDGQNLDWIEFAPVSMPPVQPNGKPYTPLAIPGTIQAENYDLDGEGVAYHDTTPGNSGGAYRHDDVDIESGNGITDVGWIRDGESLTYTVNVATTGTYFTALRVASPNSNRWVDVSFDGGRSVSYRVPNTGSFDTYTTATLGSTFDSSAPTATMTPAPTATGLENQVIAARLTAGTHTLRLVFHGDGQNFDWIAFGTGTGTTPPTPPAGGGASFVAVPTTAAHGSAVKFTVTPASGKSISAAWWSFDAPAHLNSWNSRATSPTFYYPSAGTFSPLVKLTYTDGSTETVQRANYVRAT